MARSTVIKAQSRERAEPLGLRAFRIDDVTREAQLRLAEAQRQAEEILETARQEAARLREAARQEGQRAGYAEGLVQGEQAGRAEALTAATREFTEKQAALVATCRALISNIESSRAAWEAAARQDLIDLAIAIARRIVHRVGEREREAVLANLQEAVRLAGARSDVTIVVNPKDAETARLFAQSLLDMKDQRSGLRVFEDAEVSPGGCRVQWGTGAIDASIETQLDRIAEALGSA
jgi:flagellar assembly protein FliH